MRGHPQRQAALRWRDGLVWSTCAVVLALGQWGIVSLVDGGAFWRSDSIPLALGWQWLIGVLAWAVAGSWSSVLPLRSAYAQCLARAGLAMGAYVVAVFLCFAIGDIVSGEAASWYMTWFVLMRGPAVLSFVLAAVAVGLTRRKAPGAD